MLHRVNPESAINHSTIRLGYRCSNAASQSIASVRKCEKRPPCPVRTDNGAMQRRHQAIRLEQAAQEAPVLGTLMQRLRHAQDCGRCITPLIPPMLRAHITFGVVEDGEWCLIVSGNAVAAKARQLLPIWLKQLKTQGFDVQHIRLRMKGSLQT